MDDEQDQRSIFANIAHDGYDPAASGAAGASTGIPQPGFPKQLQKKPARDNAYWPQLNKEADYPSGHRYPRPTGEYKESARSYDETGTPDVPPEEQRHETATIAPREIPTITPQPLIPQSLYEGPRESLKAVAKEWREKPPSAEFPSAGAMETYDPTGMIVPGTNVGTLADALRTMYLTGMGTGELPVGTDPDKYYHWLQKQHEIFREQYPETERLMRAGMEVGLNKPQGLMGRTGVPEPKATQPDINAAKRAYEGVREGYDKTKLLEPPREGGEPPAPTTVAPEPTPPTPKPAPNEPTEPTTSAAQPTTVAEPAEAMPTPNIGQPKTLIPFLRSRGGIQPSGETKAVDAQTIPGLINRSGMTADQAREAAVEAGYLRENPNAIATTSISDFHDLLSRAVQGERILPESAAFDEQYRLATEEAKIERARLEQDALAHLAEIGSEDQYKSLSRAEKIELQDAIARGENGDDVLENLAVRRYNDLPAISDKQLRALAKKNYIPGFDDETETTGTPQGGNGPSAVSGAGEKPGREAASVANRENVRTSGPQERAGLAQPKGIFDDIPEGGEEQEATIKTAEADGEQPLFALHPAEEAVQAGEAYKVPAETLKATIAAVQPELHLVPDEFTLGVVSEVSPDPEDPMSVEVNFVKPDGSEGLIRLPANNFFNTHALTYGPKKLILLSSLDQQALSPLALGGIIHHEITEALGVMGNSPEILDRLSSHAKTLNVLKTPYNDFADYVGYPKLEDQSGIKPLQELYEARYTNSPDIEHRIDTENAAHLVQMYHIDREKLSENQLDNKYGPVRDILEGRYNGEHLVKSGVVSTYAVSGEGEKGSIFDFDNPGGGSRVAKVGNSEITYGVDKNGRDVELILIKTPKAQRGEGSARRAMEQFLAEADERGLRVLLNADPMDKGISKNKLVDFYKSLGFKRNSGKKIDFTTRAEFIRDPQETPPHYAIAGERGAANLAMADRPAAMNGMELAKDLEDGGYSPEEIWHATSDYFRKTDPNFIAVFRDPISKKWLVETTDLGAKLTDVMHHQIGGEKISSFLGYSHPVLDTAYPYHIDIEGTIRAGAEHPQAGEYYDPAWTKTGRPSISIRAQTARDARQSLMHEITHAKTQAVEDLPRGGSPEEFLDDHDVKLDAAKLHREEGWNWDVALEIAALAKYRRLAGEEMAETARRRLAMTDDERRETPFWKSQEVPYEQQITRYSTPPLAARQQQAAPTPPDLDEHGYYSQALEAAKGLKQNKGTPEQMLAQLKSAGTKENEIAATGLRGFLEGKKSVTRKEIVDHLTENRVGLNETSYGQLRDKINKDSKYAIPEVLRAVRHSGDTPGDLQLTLENDGDAYRALTSGRFPELRDNEDWAEIVANSVFGGGTLPAGVAKWKDYSLDPNNPTYKETVLSLPDKAKSAIQIAEEKGLDWFDTTPEQRQTILREQQEGGHDVNLAFRSGHWQIPNVIGHTQTSINKVPIEDLKGPQFEELRQKLKKEKRDHALTLNLEQIQSDWGQRLRDKGVRDEAKIAELKSRIDRLDKENIPLTQEAAAWVDKHANGMDPALRSYWEQTDQRGRHQVDVLAQFPQRVPVGSDALRAEGLAFEERLKKAANERNLLTAEIATEEAATPGNPLVNTTDQWTSTTLRHAIRQAVEAGADLISIPSGDTVLSYNPGDEHGMNEFYNRIVPKNLRNIARKLDPNHPGSAPVVKLVTPTRGAVNRGNGHMATPAREGYGFTLLPLTDALKKAVTGQGQPLFARGGAVRKKVSPSYLSPEMESLLRKLARQGAVLH